MSNEDFNADVCSINEIDPEAVAFVQARVMPSRTVERLSRLFSAFADPTRLRILHALNVIQVKVLLRNKANTKNYRPPAPGKKSGVKR